MNDSVYRIKGDLQVQGQVEIGNVVVQSCGNDDIHIVAVMNNSTTKVYSIKAMQDKIDSLEKQIAELILLGVKQ